MANHFWKTPCVPWDTFLLLTLYKSASYEIPSCRKICYRITSYGVNLCRIYLSSINFFGRFLSSAWAVRR